MYYAVEIRDASTKAGTSIPSLWPTTIKQDPRQIIGLENKTDRSWNAASEKLPTPTQHLLFILSPSSLVVYSFFLLRLYLVCVLCCYLFLTLSRYWIVDTDVLLRSLAYMWLGVSSDLDLANGILFVGLFATAVQRTHSHSIASSMFGCSPIFHSSHLANWGLLILPETGSVSVHFRICCYSRQNDRLCYHEWNHQFTLNGAQVGKRLSVWVNAIYYWKGLGDRKIAGAQLLIISINSWLCTGFMGIMLPSYRCIMFYS
jgi:hypothetical protein